MGNALRAFAAKTKGGSLQPYEYDPGELGSGQVEIAVQYCGVCPSALSMLQNQWGLTQFPFVQGHEVVGTVSYGGKPVNLKGPDARVQRITSNLLNRFKA